jgi:hypothetical protein
MKNHDVNKLSSWFSSDEKVAGGFRTFSPIACGLVVVIAGCRPATERRDASASECARVGQTCEIAAGKLGTCVQRDDCTAGSCLVCQSQH